MKRRCFRGLVTHVLGFPGLHRPGLIEAHRICLRGPQLCADFRGFIAPASLKLLNQADEVGAKNRDFRGFIAPASLKRYGSAQPQGTNKVDFRGFIAPASLKPIPCELLGRERGLDFRGFIAPASLKREGEATGQHVLGRFPGLHRPGLIEACVRTRWSSGRTGFPGLHRPGLIEAGPATTSRRAIAGDFRGFIAPASLKREREQPWVLVELVDFRGFIAPASLKPERKRACEPLEGRDFRGFIAPASLKLVNVAHPPRTVLDFRGFIAPASLKHDLAKQPDRSQTAISGASSPRPH